MRFRPLDTILESKTVSGLYKFDAPLFFANTEYLLTQGRALIEGDRPHYEKRRRRLR